MANFRVMNDLKTILNSGFTFGNVTGLSAKPSIRLETERSPSAIANGEVVFTDARRVRSERTQTRRNEVYLVDGYCYFRSAAAEPTDQTLSEMMDENERVFDAESDDITGEYVIEIVDSREIGPFSEGKHIFVIEAKRVWVLADGS